MKDSRINRNVRIQLASNKKKKAREQSSKEWRKDKGQ